VIKTDAKGLDTTEDGGTGAVIQPVSPQQQQGKGMRSSAETTPPFINPMVCYIFSDQENLFAPADGEYDDGTWDDNANVNIDDSSV
jgi:hypothetical protein